LEDDMSPESAEAVRIADKHLAGESVERRKALALDIVSAIVRYAEGIAMDAIDEASASRKQAPAS
jgi:hypothetical protein